MHLLLGACSDEMLRRLLLKKSRRLAVFGCFLSDFSAEVLVVFGSVASSVVDSVVVVVDVVDGACVVVIFRVFGFAAGGFSVVDFSVLRDE